MMAISVIGVLAMYAINFEEVNLLLKQGQHMATPCNHIRFSQLVALSVLAGWYLIKTKYNSRIAAHGIIVKILTVILFLSLHILSVKTGLVGLYATLFILTIRHIYTTRNYKVGVVVLAVMILLPLVAYKTCLLYTSDAADE